MNLSIVVPCYNEERNIRPFYEKAVAELGSLLDDAEFVFINDGSRDNTLSELRALCDSAPHKIRVVSFSRNFGKEAGLLAGLQHSRGDHVAIIDADLQQNPKYIKQMLEILRQHPSCDGVAAYQRERSESKLLCFFKNAFYKLINKMTEVEFYRSASDFRLLSRRMVDAILSMPEKCRFSKGIFAWIGFNVYYMPYDVEERNAGSSKWSFWKLTAYAVNGIVSFSDKPLVISSVLGFILFVISVIMMLAVVIKTLLFGDPVAGFPTLASLLLFLSGIQLLCIGIVGQYLSKMYTEIKGRPVYLVGEEFENNK